MLLVMCIQAAHDRPDQPAVPAPPEAEAPGEVAGLVGPPGPRHRWTLTNAAGVVGKDLTDEQAAELIAAASVASNLRDGRLVLLPARGCGCGNGTCSCQA